MGIVGKSITALQGRSPVNDDAIPGLRESVEVLILDSGQPLILNYMETMG